MKAYTALVMAAAMVVFGLVSSTQAQTSGRYVPKGAYIMLPATSACPAGYADNATLNSGRFPRGGYAAETGGSNLHAHGVSDHNHYLTDSFGDLKTDTGREAYGYGVEYKERTYGSGGYEPYSSHTHSIDGDALTSASGLTTTHAADGRPPYATVRFCQAQ